MTITRKMIRRYHKENPYEARSEAYIADVLEAVRQLWLAHPHERLGQLLVNHLGRDVDMFNALDENWVGED